MRWKKSPRISYIFLRWMRWIIYFHRILGILTKKTLPYTGLNRLPTACLQYLIPLRQLSITSLVFLVNLRKCWKKAFNFWKKCGEKFFSLHSPQSPNFLQKFTAISAFLTKIHPKTSTRVMIYCVIASPP